MALVFCSLFWFRSCQWTGFQVFKTTLNFVMIQKVFDANYQGGDYDPVSARSGLEPLGGATNGASRMPMVSSNGHSRMPAARPAAKTSFRRLFSHLFFGLLFCTLFFAHRLKFLCARAHWQFFNFCGRSRRIWSESTWGLVRNRGKQLPYSFENNPHSNLIRTRM